MIEEGIFSTVLQVSGRLTKHSGLLLDTWGIGADGGYLQHYKSIFNVTAGGDIIPFYTQEDI